MLVTGLTAAILALTVSPQAAQAYPRAASCTRCHAGATTTTVMATPSAGTQLAGASYTVAITLTANPNGGNTGYGIVPVAPAVEKTFGGNTRTELALTATMIAPAVAGTYSYTVWTTQGLTDGSGQVGSKVYSITVAGRNYPADHGAADDYPADDYPADDHPADHGAASVHRVHQLVVAPAREPSEPW